MWYVSLSACKQRLHIQNSAFNWSAHPILSVHSHSVQHYSCGASLIASGLTMPKRVMKYPAADAWPSPKRGKARAHTKRPAAKSTKKVEAGTLRPPPRSLEKVSQGKGALWCLHSKLTLYADRGIGSEAEDGRYTSQVGRISLSSLRWWKIGRLMCLPFCEKSANLVPQIYSAGMPQIRAASWLPSCFLLCFWPKLHTSEETSRCPMLRSGRCARHFGSHCPGYGPQTSGTPLQELGLLPAPACVEKGPAHQIWCEAQAVWRGGWWGGCGERSGDWSEWSSVGAMGWTGWMGRSNHLGIFPSFYKDDCPSSARPKPYHQEGLETGC